ncbi:A24 family peptidase [Aurantiacibacter zhengii]|uniref:Peptidase n=1 Tax=Aurantiacibacter zhengii TaxID=2307003 RepID=A0A418NV24_9SPHN|nr:prepilin peptidase [Aurantiacibacter zhengii]RIV87893.1 peptidase [Aurantiacibacter zhengii]
MLDDPIKYGLLAALAIALIWAAVTDLKSRRIANWLNAAIAIGAPVFWFASDFALWPDVAIQIGLGLLVFTICSLLFAIRQMGGGDVKLLTALSLWMTPMVLLKLVIMMALLGGVLTLVVGARNVMTRRNKEKTRWQVPYGVAISAAGLWIIGTMTMNASALAAAGQ